MKIITTYVADDGKEFKSRAECERHEAVLNADLESYVAKWEALMPQGESFIHACPNMASIENTIDRAQLVRVNRFIPANESTRVYEETGFRLPFDCGLYRYDTEENRWIEFHEDIDMYINDFWFGYRADDD